MGITCRAFIADNDHVLSIPLARWHRILEGKEILPQTADRELKTIEVVIEVERRVVRRAIRVLPIRMKADDRGRVDMDDLKRQAMERIPDPLAPRTIDAAIADLQRDASYFWPLVDSHWHDLSRLLALPVRSLKNALHRAPVDS